MGIVSGHRIIHNLMAGNLSGAQLATYLNTGNNKASYQQAILSSSQNRALSASPIGIEAALSAGVLVGSLLNQIAIMGGAAHTPELEAAVDMAAVAASTTAMNAVIASATAMNSVAASTTAMAAVAASTTAMNAVAASTTAMNSVAASTTAMNAVAASTTAKMACFNSDIALAAFAGSATALTALRAVGAYSVISKTAGSGAQTIPGPTAGQSYILLGVSKGTIGIQTITTLTTGRSGSSRPVVADAAATSASTAQTVTLCTPLVSPFTFTASNASGYEWYFGLLRCDI